MHRDDHTLSDMARQNQGLPPEPVDPHREMDEMARSAVELRKPIDPLPRVKPPRVVDDFEYDTRDLDSEILDPVDLDEVFR